MRKRSILMSVLILPFLAAAVRADDEPTLADYITVAAEYADVPESWLWATGEIESGNDHWRDGEVVRGKAKEIGWGQIMYSPWTKWAGHEDRLDRDVDLFDLGDNVLVCAMILRYYIDQHGMDIVTVCGSYNAGNGRCNRRYGRKVAKAEEKYRDE